MAPVRPFSRVRVYTCFVRASRAPRPAAAPLHAARSRPPRRPTRAGLAVVALGFASVPLWLKDVKSGGGAKNLTTQATSLGGSSTMRGAYSNYGSKDVGADPDWDASMQYKGKSKAGMGGAGFNPSPEDIALHRAALTETLRQRGLLKEAAPPPAPAGVGAGAAAGGVEDR